MRPPGKPLLSHFASSPFPHLECLRAAGTMTSSWDVGRWLTWASVWLCTMMRAGEE